MSVRQRLKRLEQAAAGMVRKSTPSATAESQLEAFRALSAAEMRAWLQDEPVTRTPDDAALQAYRALPLEEMLPALQRVMNR